MKTRNKAFLLALSAVLIIIATAFGTLAYLTSEITVTHTFTVGDVKMKVTAHNTATVSLDDFNLQTGYEEKLIPNRGYYLPVAVQIEADSEDAWVFIQVVNQVENIEAASVNGEYKTIAEQVKAYGWTPLIYEENGETVEVKDVYCYNGIVSAGESGTQLPVYEFFKVNEEALRGTYEEAVAEAAEEGFTVDETKKELYLGDYNGKKIIVVAYVVQADGLDSVSSAWSVFKDNYKRICENPDYYEQPATQTQESSEG